MTTLLIVIVVASVLWLVGFFIFLAVGFPRRGVEDYFADSAGPGPESLFVCGDEIRSHKDSHQADRVSGSLKRLGAKRLSEALQSTGRKTVLLPSELPKAKKDVLQVLQDVLNKGSDSLPVPQNSAMAVELPTQ